MRLSELAKEKRKFNSLFHVQSAKVPVLKGGKEKVFVIQFELISSNNISQYPLHGEWVKKSVTHSLYSK